MLAIMSAVFGFAGPFIPELLRYFRAGQDQKFELERMRLSAELAEREHAWRMAEMEAKADIQESAALHKPTPSFGVQILDRAASSDLPRWCWVPVFWLFALADFVATSVRPNVTYAMVGLYMLHKWGQIWLLRQTISIEAGGETVEGFFGLVKMTAVESAAWGEAVAKTWTEQDFGVLLLCLGYWFGTRSVKSIFGGNAAHGGAGK